MLSDLVYCVQRRARFTIAPRRPLPPVRANRLPQHMLRGATNSISVGGEFCEKMFHVALLGKYTRKCKGKLPNTCIKQRWVQFPNAR